MRIFMISLMLFILSVCFVITMDLMFLQIPLQVTLDNLIVPFRSMMNEEVLIMFLLFLYLITKPVVIYFMNKK